MSKKNVCLTTFISGIKYQSYIPFLIYTCNKAYPEYDIHLFLYEKLDSKIKSQIDLISLKCNLRIDEEVFSEFRNISTLKAKALRYVLWDESFLNYDYLYTVDIDMLYIREPIPLHTQHELHMKFVDLPISNLIRRFSYHPLHYLKIGKRLKYAGFKSFFKYLSFSRTELKLTGLHFVDVKEYFKRLTPEKLNKYKLDIFNDDFLNYTLWPNCEIFIANMCKQSGIKIENLGVQENQEKMLEFENPERKEFRPHHGIHLGIFRTKNNMNSQKPILNSATYQFYVHSFKNDIMTDPEFNQILENAPTNIKEWFNSFYEYYKLNQ